MNRRIAIPLGFILVAAGLAVSAFVPSRTGAAGSGPMAIAAAPVTAPGIRAGKHTASHWFVPAGSPATALASVALPGIRAGKQASSRGFATAGMNTSPAVIVAPVTAWGAPIRKQASSHWFVSTAVTDTTGYTLVWGDEFNTNGAPDPAKWDYERGFVRNREPQWYQPSNAWCKDGLLVIEARKEKHKNPAYDSSSKDWRHNREYAEYTSACLITKGKYEFRYGKVTMRAKIDVRKGMWPAFWMLGSNRGPVYWPACGEVDIMEFYRGNLLANAAWEGNNNTSWDEAKWPVAAWGGEQWAAEFHEWVLEWDENSMAISVDGRTLNTVDLTNTQNHKQGNNPFRENFYLLLNLALGQSGEQIPDEHIPAQMLVDYVRVYQKKGS